MVTCFLNILGRNGNNHRVKKLLSERLEPSSLSVLRCSSKQEWRLLNEVVVPGSACRSISPLGVRFTLRRPQPIRIQESAIQAIQRRPWRRFENEEIASGKEVAVEQKSAISKDVLIKLGSYFDEVLEVGDPVKLTYYNCFYFLSLSLSRCICLSIDMWEAEVQVKLKKKDIVFSFSSDGKEYVTLGLDFMLKNFHWR